MNKTRFARFLARIFCFLGMHDYDESRWGHCLDCGVCDERRDLHLACRYRKAHLLVCKDLNKYPKFESTLEEFNSEKSKKDRLAYVARLGAEMNEKFDNSTERERVEFRETLGYEEKNDGL